jgi:ubiquinone/menaquinone biosynthesis C-methylase UbiE
MDDKYSQVVDANIALHTQLAAVYNTDEPHFRPENVAKVEERLRAVCAATNATRLLDLGCGTGFMVNIAKRYVKEIVGVDVTQAMMDKVDLSGPASITLVNCDTGSYDVAEGAFDVVTAYSFLHHLYDIGPSLRTAYRALKSGGRFYADLDPNFYFWEEIGKLDRDGEYDQIVKREIQMTIHKDEDIQERYGIDAEVFNNAEFGKNIAGGFREEDLVAELERAGFQSVEVFHHWFLGEGQLINDESMEKGERLRHAEVMSTYLQKSMPLSRHLYKYLGFIAEK